MSVIEPCPVVPSDIVSTLALGPRDMDAIRVGYWRSTEAGGPSPHLARSLAGAKGQLACVRAGQHKRHSKSWWVPSSPEARSGECIVFDLASDLAKLEEFLEKRGARYEQQSAAWARLPWPGDHLDPDMSGDRRAQIADLLSTFPVVASYCGNSPSRLSAGTCGGAERGNGAYVWPVGVEHYVVDHGLMLPPEFLASIGGAS